jgi:hypothetical protein
MSLKYVALLAVVGAAIWGVAGHETSAQDCAGRTVPVTVCNPAQLCPEMAPSRMVAATALAAGAGSPVRIPVTLPENKVLVVTSWSAAAETDAGAVVTLIEGPTYSLTIVRDLGRVYQRTSYLHHILPTGIRFPRDANGNAAVYATTDASQAVCVSVQGYIADDI